MKRAAVLSTLVLCSALACGLPKAGPGERPALFVEHGDLPAVRARGALRVLVPALAEPDALGGGSPAAEERELMAAFAERIGVRADFIAVERRADLFDLLEAGYGDIVAAQLTVTEERRRRFRFTRPTNTVSEWVVGRKGAPGLPRRLEDLDGKTVHVRRSSAFAESLASAKREHGLGVDVVFVEEGLDTEEIAYEVSRGKRPLTVVDSNLLAAIESYNEELEPLFVLREGRELAWALRQEAEELGSAADAFVIEHVLTSHRLEDRTTGDLDAVLRRGSLRVLTLNNPVHFFLYRGRRMGFDYEIGKLAAERLGVRLELVVPPRRDLVFDWLLEGRADVIASTLTVTGDRQDFLSFSTPYLFIQELVVQAADAPAPANGPADLVGRRIHAWESSSHYRSLLALHATVGPFEIVPVPEDMEFDEILDRVGDGTFPLAVVDSHILEAELSFRDDVVVAFPLLDPRQRELGAEHTVVAWDKAVAFAGRRDNPELRRFLDEFVAATYGSLELNVAVNRYFRDNRSLARVRGRRAGVTGRLSPYDALFKKYAKRYGLDWRLMVAQAYQESRFDSRAESWSGAVGLFQVLPSTGHELGFGDLTDPETSIHAGFKYLDLLVARLDPRIPLKHRLRFALAAYNAGWGHLQDARRLTEEKGWDPDRWFGQVERAMLLLRRPEYYRRARHGYVRGTEPVQYVSEIQNRYDHYVTLVPP